MKDKPIVGDESFRREFLRRLNDIKGVALPESALTKRPGISLKTLAVGENTRRFLEVMNWFIGEWRRIADQSPNLAPMPEESQALS